jgi:zinc/manganese transport system substrate-binding protein
VGLVLLAASLVGCGRTGHDARGGRVEVVAAENFYGDLAADVGGERTAVTSIVSSPDADPHLFEPGGRSGLSVATARVVIRNGVGYDDWMTRLLAAAPAPDRQLVTVAAVLHVRGADPNPHLWYDVPALPGVVAAIGEALAAADPAHRRDYRAGVTRTIAGLRPLANAVSQLKAQHSGAPVAYTERVPGLLLAAAGLRVRTPPSFARAVEDGTGASRLGTAEASAALASGGGSCPVRRPAIPSAVSWSPKPGKSTAPPAAAASPAAARPTRGAPG